MERNSENVMVGLSSGDLQMEDQKSQRLNLCVLFRNHRYSKNCSGALPKSCRGFYLPG
jgi:hypothetical protein